MQRGKPQELSFLQWLRWMVSSNEKVAKPAGPSGLQDGQDQSTVDIREVPFPKPVDEEEEVIELQRDLAAVRYLLRDVAASLPQVVKVVLRQGHPMPPEKRGNISDCQHP